MSSPAVARLQRVAIGMDFAEPSVRAASWIADQLSGTADILLVHAVDAPVPDDLAAPRPRPDADISRDVQASATERLQQLARDLPARSVEVRTDGDRPAWAISRAADEWGADLVVVGPHDGTNSAWERLGSTAERIVRMSAVPVLMAAAVPAHPIGSILVAVDHVDLTPAVLHWAGLVASATGARVTLLHALETTVRPGEVAGGHLEQGAERKWLAALAAELPSTANVLLEVVSGEADSVVLSAARRTAADLIVLGRRGRGRSVPAVLGSTVSRVLRRAPCPVLVVVDPQDAVLDMWDLDLETGQQSPD